MTIDYFLFVFIAAIGVYQIAALTAGLRGLCFYRNSKIQAAFGVLAISGAVGWFFTAENRNVQHNVEGTQQLGLFLMAIVSAYIVTPLFLPH